MSGQPGGQPPSEDELRAAYEQELRRITATDMMAQAAVSLLNVGALRLGAPGGGQGSEQGARPERDLEQARDAIDGARALVGILERRIPQELAPIRAALSQLQMAYAREVQTGPGESPAPTATPGAGAPATSAPTGEQAGGTEPAPQSTQEGERPPGPGPAESSGRLWVPGRCARASAPDAGLRAAERNDRLRPRLHRIDARAERSGRQMCARRSSRGTPNQTAEDFS